jgi:hypothetical protein
MPVHHRRLAWILGRHHRRDLAGRAMRIRAGNRRRKRQKRSLHARFDEVYPMGLIGSAFRLMRSEPIQLRIGDRIGFISILPRRKPPRAYTVIQRSSR